MSLSARRPVCGYAHVCVCVCVRAVLRGMELKHKYSDTAAHIQYIMLFFDLDRCVLNCTRLCVCVRIWSLSARERECDIFRSLSFLFHTVRKESYATFRDRI